MLLFIGEKNKEQMKVNIVNPLAPDTRDYTCFCTGMSKEDSKAQDWNPFAGMHKLDLMCHWAVLGQSEQLGQIPKKA